MKIAELKEKERVEGSYLVTKKESATGKTGKPYLMVRLMDSTGEIEARVWEDAAALSKSFDSEEVAKVRGYVSSYKGELQINIDFIDRLKPGEYSLRDFLPSSERDPKEMIRELDGVIAGFGDPDLKSLFTLLFKEGGEVRERFMESPAAKGMHHNYLGGLLEHVLSLCSVAEFLGSHYEAVNKDMLMAGVILHDIGKIYELSSERGFEYTDSGRLLGHITIGAEMVDSAVREIEGFPREKAMLLKHMILGHHGRLEFGSPMVPKTLEAIVLHYIDDLDAKIEAVTEATGNIPEEEAWTPFHRQMERFLYKGAGKQEKGAEVKEKEKEREKEREPGLF